MTEIERIKRETVRKDENWRQEKEEMKVSMAKLEQLNQKLQSFASPAQPLETKLKELEDALSEKEARIIGMQDQEITMQHDFEAKTERSRNHSTSCWIRPRRNQKGS